MNTEPAIKLIKKEERKGPEPQAEVKRAVDPNRWSTAVKLWVSEFQRRRHGESLPAFALRSEKPERSLDHIFADPRR